MRALLARLFPRLKPKPAAKPAVPPPPRDGVREVLETVTFVVALVLLLKLFVAEAFVIPTGSMAETLYGYQKVVTCEDCGRDYPVNSSDEVDPQRGDPRPVVLATCPNCRFKSRLAPGKPGNNSGDRVLIHKAVYALQGGPSRADVVVFKYPVDPQAQHGAVNYIKRLWGLGGETIAIYRGDLYVHRTLAYPADAKDDAGRPLYPRPEPGKELKVWEGPQTFQHSNTQPRYAADNNDYTYHNAEAALAAFEASRLAGFDPAAPGGGFELVRKPDDVALAMRRVVYDADHQSDHLAKLGVPPRWADPVAGGWAANDPRKPTAFTHAGPARHTLTYSHRVGGPLTEVTDPNGVPVLDQFGRRGAEDDAGKWRRGAPREGLFTPQPVTNFLGYNTGEDPDGSRRNGNGAFWVPDLTLECAATVSDARDEVTLDLAKSGRRFRATFKDGMVSLTVAAGGTVAPETVIASAPTRITSGGTYDLRFGQVDGRLRVAVDGRRIDFGPAADVPPWDNPGSPAAGTNPDGFAPANDLAPAQIHATGAVAVAQLKLWMDSYFTPAENLSYADRANPVDTFFVHPGHYLCLGDNSGFSSDSRKWGVVPDRLLLGKAMAIFFPFPRIGFIK